MGQETGGRFKREGIYVYLWLIHVEVWQKTKFCKAVILQLKFFLRKWKSLSHVQLSATPWTMEFSRPEYCSGYSLLQGIFPTQGSNPGLPHCRQVLYQLSHQGSPRALDGVGSLSLLQQIFPNGSPALQADSLPVELPGKLPKYSGISSNYWVTKNYWIY